MKFKKKKKKFKNFKKQFYESKGLYVNAIEPHTENYHMFRMELSVECRAVRLVMALSLKYI